MPTGKAEDIKRTKRMRLAVHLVALVFLVPSSDGSRPCSERHTNVSDHSHMVCVCNATFCDDIAPLGEIGTDEALTYVSSAGGKRFERSRWHWLSSKAYKLRQTINGPALSMSMRVTGSQKYQQILGFGGAFTDAAAINFDSLQESAARQNLLESYYGKQGIEYTIGRVPIASCDFSTHEYSYAEEEGDFGLKSFVLHAEDLQKIPYLLEANRLSGGKLKLFGSPWSAPAWMKSNGHMKGGGTLKNDTPTTPYHSSYANYFVRFLEEYAKRNVTFWGLTVQNEPSTGADPNYAFQTMLFTPEMEVQFVKNHLGPTLQRSQIGKNVNLMICDDFRDNIVDYANTVLNDPDAKAFVSGIAVHWYGDSSSNLVHLSETHNHHPDKFILSTEVNVSTRNEFFLQACNYKVDLGSWDRGNAYAVDIIQDLNHWVSGWVDWNLALNPQGGPNWVSNFVDSPIIVNVTAGEFYKQPMYYVMGQFSKFIPPGSVRIGLEWALDEPEFDAVAFETPGNRRVIVMRNSGVQQVEFMEVTIADFDKGDRRLSVQIEPRSITTVIYTI